MTQSLEDADDREIQKAVPRLNALGYLSFSASDVERVRTILEAESFPVSEAEVVRRLGFPLESVQRWLFVSAGGGGSQTYVLSPDCTLKVDFYLWDESDALQGMEVLCSEDSFHISVPAIPEPLEDRASALREFGLTPDDVVQWPRCRGALADLDSVFLECFRMSDEQRLLIQTTELGVSIATRKVIAPQ